MGHPLKGGGDSADSGERTAADVDLKTADVDLAVAEHELGHGRVVSEGGAEADLRKEFDSAITSVDSVPAEVDPAMAELQRDVASKTIA
ncbi:unnamed protein product [Urochloa humidicola]